MIRTVDSSTTILYVIRQKIYLSTRRIRFIFWYNVTFCGEGSLRRYTEDGVGNLVRTWSLTNFWNSLDFRGKDQTSRHSLWCEGIVLTQRYVCREETFKMNSKDSNKLNSSGKILVRIRVSFGLIESGVSTYLSVTTFCTYKSLRFFLNGQKLRSSLGSAL